MKKQAFIISTVLASLFLGTLVFAAPTSTIVRDLIITNQPNKTCLGTDGTGLVGAGTCTGGGGSGSVSTSSAITAGYFPFWTSSTGQLSGTSTIFTSGGNVGIGTSAPSSTLHIVSATNSTSSLVTTQTWNSGATIFTPWLLDITDTTSSASSLLMNLRVGGGSKLSVTKAGVLSTASTISSGGNLGLTASGGVQWNGRSTLQSAANGNVSLGNNTGTDFNLLQFGGTTASFPALKSVSSTLTLAARTADDSADVAFSAATGTFSGRVLAKQGASVATQPAFSFYDASSTGFYQTNSGQTINVTFAGTNALSFAYNRITNARTDTGASMPALLFGGDTYFGRNGVGLWQMGLDAASPVSHTLQAAGGLGTDKAGANLTIQGGLGTGTGAGGSILFTTALASTTSGSAFNVTSTRMIVTQDGLVGIGTTQPSSTLHVVGTSTLIGTTTIGAGLTTSTARFGASGKGFCGKEYGFDGGVPTSTATYYWMEKHVRIYSSTSSPCGAF